MLQDGLLVRVEVDPDGAGSALEEALRHVDSAGAIRLTDPNGAYQLAYDAARKAVMSHMRRNGIRVRRGEGAHAILASYAALAIDEGLGKRLDGMRRRRNRSEYGSAYFNDDDVRDATAVAASLIAAVSDNH
jgi:hypothetical protein